MTSSSFILLTTWRANVEQNTPFGDPKIKTPCKSKTYKVFRVPRAGTEPPQRKERKRKEIIDNQVFKQLPIFFYFLTKLPISTLVMLKLTPF